MQRHKRLLPTLLAFAVAIANPSILTAEEKMSQDAETLQALAEAGSDLSKPHPIDHWLYFEDQSAARAAGAELVSAGFAVRSIEAVPEHAEWRLLAQKTMVPRLADVEATSAFLDEVARKHHGD
ncbi:MAG: ribonuclease E inhibitor RraB, partial [Steroidobacteraceae bacterium]